MVRPLHHLGARSWRQSGEGIHRREQVDARFQRREDRAQDCAQGGPERPDHPQGCTGAGGESPAGRQFVPRYRTRAADDAIYGGLGVDWYPDGRIRSNPQIRPGATAIRQADRFVPDDSGSARKDACQSDRVPVPDAPTVAWGREVLGGNGIVADYNVARFFADAEALYSYEGTYQMQNLIVGKAITGHGAFL